MVPGNRLELTSAADLDREEERISKKRALALFDTGLRDKLNASTVVSLQTIHKYLFDEIYYFAGKIRTVNIAKGNSRFAPVMYLEVALENIDKMPQSTFNEIAEKYVEMNIAHPFREGNTRATAVFMIKYMKTFGFRINNDAFRENFWYFRNALVRANYNDLQKGIHSTTKFLELFFSNLLLSTKHELKNRYMHVDFVDENASQSAKNESPKCQIDTLKCTLEELAVLDLIKKNPSIKQAELAEQTGKSVRSIKRIIDSLKEKQYIRRVDGKRYGKWEVLVWDNYVGG